MRRSARGPVVVLSPHLDDAVLGCFTVLDEGGARVVNVFDAAPPAGVRARWDAITGEPDSVKAFAARVEEDRAVLGALGATPTGLGFLDEQYRDDEPAPDAAGIREALEAAIPAASRIYAPAGIGRHPDHQAVAQTAVELAYDSIPVTLFAELPYATQHGWPSWVTGGPSEPNLNPEAVWESSLEDLPCYRTALAPAVRRLPDDQAQRKLEAMRAYGSQFPALNGGPLNRLANPRIFGYEVFWEVRLPGGQLRSQTRRGRLRRLLHL